MTKDLSGLDIHEVVATKGSNPWTKGRIVKQTLFLCWDTTEGLWRPELFRDWPDAGMVAWHAFWPDRDGQCNDRCGFHEVLVDPNS